MVQMCFANGTLYNVAQCEPFDLTYSYTNSQYSCVIYVYIYEQSVAAELHILNDDICANTLLFGDDGEF